MPELLGYRRKDPFQQVHYLFNLINEAALFYTPLDNHSGDEKDEWDLLYRKNQLQPHFIIYDAIESSLSLNYCCPKCKDRMSVPHNIQFLKLNIPKQKRKAKEVEKELAEHRYSSPMKTRRKSLANLLWKDEEVPLTIVELIIDLMKQPLHKE